MVGRTLLLPRYFDPHYRDTHSQKKKFEDVFDESTLREFTSVEFVDEDVIKLWKTSPKILASPLNKERLAKALHNVGFDQAPRKKAFVRSHSRAADVAQAFKGFSAAGAVFVALCVFSVLPSTCRPRCRWGTSTRHRCDSRRRGDGVGADAARRRRVTPHTNAGRPSSSSTASRTCCGRRRGIGSGPSASGRSPQH